MKLRCGQKLQFYLDMTIRQTTTRIWDNGYLCAGMMKSRQTTGNPRQNFGRCMVKSIILHMDDGCTLSPNSWFVPHVIHPRYTLCRPQVSQIEFAADRACYDGYVSELATGQSARRSAPRAESLLIGIEITLTECDLQINMSRV